jgi:transposase-like protein
MKELPDSLLEAVRFFSDADNAREFLAVLHWPNGKAICPACSASDSYFLNTRKVWKCKACGKQYSVKVGTIFEDSPVGLDKWLPTAWLIINCKNGVSSCEIARHLKVTQKTAWFMLHRIRLAMQCGSFRKASGEVEVDETFIGGKARNMHVSKRERRITGTGPMDKTAVLGILERGVRFGPALLQTEKRKSCKQKLEHTWKPERHSIRSGTLYGCAAFV